jgi:excisionase family DNA binding protein
MGRTGENRVTSANDTEGPEYMTVAEVAVRMRVSRATIYRLVHNGELPRMKVGKILRVPRAAVADFIRRSSYGDT